MFQQSRLIVALLAALVSRDTTALDVLLTIDDLPSGWRRSGESRLRMGFTYDEERDKRARRAKLIGAARTFVNAESRSRVVAQAYPTVTEEDADSGVAAAFERRFGPYDLNVRTRDEVEVTPPPEAGDRARAQLVGTSGSMGDWRALTVAWADSGPLLLAITCRAPAEADLWDLSTTLIQRQRERLAHRALRSSD